MPKLSVAERLDKIAQRKAKDERLEARLKLIQKKADSRSAAEISRLAIKAGIDQLSPAALYGAFLEIAATAATPERLAAWEVKGKLGVRAAENDNREVAIVKFAAKPATDTTAGLRKLGFRWNSILGQFEGRVAYEEAAAFVSGAGGTISRVAAAGEPGTGAALPRPIAPPRSPTHDGRSGVDQSAGQPAMRMLVPARLAR